MSTVIIGGGPRPQARVVVVNDVGQLGDLLTGTGSYEIRDGLEVVASFAKLSHARALLPLIQSGE